MTKRDNEWYQCCDPGMMLPLVRDTASRRKSRLFAVACSLRQAALLSDDARQALLVAEQFADGLIDQQELGRAHKHAQIVLDSFPDPDVWHTLSVYDQDRVEAERNAVWAVVDATQELAWQAAEESPVAAASAAAWVARTNSGAGNLGKSRDLAADRGYDDERTVQAAILRDIFGSPFSKPASILSRPPECVVGMARVIYEDKTFHQMKDLAEILEQTGALGADARLHCLSSDPHVRGCWVLDSLLGKEDWGS